MMIYILVMILFALFAFISNLSYYKSQRKEAGEDFRILEKQGCSFSSLNLILLFQSFWIICFTFLLSIPGFYLYSNFKISFAYFKKGMTPINPFQITPSLYGYSFLLLLMILLLPLTFTLFSRETESKRNKKCKKNRK